MKRISMLLALAALLGVAILACGCTDEIPKPVQTDEIEGAPEVPRNLTTSVADGRVLLSWEVSEPAKISRYMIYRGDTTFAAPVLIDSSTTTSFNDTGLRNSLRYIYLVTAIGTNGLESDFSRAVSATPNIYSVLINQNAEFTNSRNVTVSFAAPAGTRLVMVANDANFSGAQWIGYTPAISWQLNTDDGVQEVFARFNDAEGNDVIGTSSDDIILDTRAAIVSLTENSQGATLNVGDKVTFVMNTGEPNGNASVEIEGVTSLPLIESTVSNVGIYSAEYTIPGGIDVVDAVITGNFRDAAGNDAPALILTSFINIANPPAAAQLTGFAISEEEIELSWTRTIAQDFQSYQIFRSETATVNSSSLLIRTETSAANTSFRDADLDPGKDYYYVVYTVDRTGLKTASNSVRLTTIANVAPTAVSLFKSDEDTLSVTLGWTVNTDEDFESYHVYRSVTTPVSTTGTTNLVGVITSQGANSFTDGNINVGQQFYYVVVVFDKFGARSANSNEVRGPNP